MERLLSSLGCPETEETPRGSIRDCCLMQSVHSSKESRGLTEAEEGQVRSGEEGQQERWQGWSRESVASPWSPTELPLNWAK